MDKFSYNVHLKAIRAYNVDIVNCTEETNGDWDKLKTYRRLLLALGLLGEDCSTKSAKRKRKEENGCGRQVKSISNFTEHDKNVVIKFIGQVSLEDRWHVVAC